jgi:hypothetical protein
MRHRGATHANHNPDRWRGHQIRTSENSHNGTGHVELLGTSKKRSRDFTAL